MEKKELSPRVELVTVDPIVAAPVTIEDVDRVGKSASPGLRKNHQALLADTSMDVPNIGQHDYVPKAMNMSHDVDLTPPKGKNGDVS